MDARSTAVLECIDQLRALAGRNLDDMREYAGGPFNESYEAAELDVERLQRLSAFFVAGSALVARLIVASTNVQGPAN